MSTHEEPSNVSLAALACHRPDLDQAVHTVRDEARSEAEMTTKNERSRATRFRIHVRKLRALEVDLICHVAEATRLQKPFGGERGMILSVLA